MKSRIAEHEIAAFVRAELLPLILTKRIILFYGPMGTGKTTFIKEIARQLGLQDTLTSPTFGYVNSYHLNIGDLIQLNHFDLYRIATVDEFIQAGFDELLDCAHHLNLVEWPSVIEALLEQHAYAQKTIAIKLSYDGNNRERRMIELI